MSRVIGEVRAPMHGGGGNRGSNKRSNRRSNKGSGRSNKGSWGS
jgi:hypothetical protein